MSEIIKIGFIDYYLDEWHANNYPEFIRKASGGKAAAALIPPARAVPAVPGQSPRIPCR